jgi:galactose oxidase-like protein
LRSGSTFLLFAGSHKNSKEGIPVHPQPRIADIACRVLVLSVLIGILFVTGCAGGGTQNNSSAPVTYTIGGTVSGLSGTGLVLQDNGGNNLSVSANGTFTFTTPVSSGNGYSVAVLSQPSSPTQTCLVANGSGTVGSANVMSVVVACTNTSGTYTIGGTISGLSGTGLVVQDNGINNLTISAGATSFTITTGIISGNGYNVTISSQPSSPSQTCVVANGSGTVGNANVTNIQITCITIYTIGGTVSGLLGTGLILQDNGGNNLSVSAGATGFTFATPIASGSSFNVTVLTQPSSPAQTCKVTSGSGTASANVTNIQVTCTTTTVTYTIGGTISGLSSGGLQLQDNGGNNLSVTAGATSFTFPTPIASGSTYNVTISSQPNYPSQTCAVTNGSGAVGNANITSIQITCTTNTYTIGGTFYGLPGSGLVLQDNGGNNLSVSAGATGFTFTTPIASGGAYSVTLLTQPSSPAQNCVVANGSGIIGFANVASVAISCSTGTYTIGGTVSGLSGTGLVLQDNGGNNLPVSANGNFTFTSPVSSGNGYSVTVLTQPSSPAQTCGVTSGTGGVTTANVTSVQVICTTTTVTYTIGGTVSGLSGTGLVLQDNGGNNLPVSANGTFTFTTAIASGGAYSVTVLTQPSSPAQTCTVTSGSGTASANVTSVVVTCTTTTVTYTIGGTVLGLSGTGLVLQDNGGNNLPVSANGTFTFTTAIASGGAYSVTVLMQPSSPAQNCVVANGSGTVASANVTSVVVACVTEYTVGGTISGLSGSGLVLQDNGGNNLPISANGSFTFTTPIASGSTFNVTVFSQPSNPAQTCGVASGSGTVASANVTSVVVTCTTIYTIGGTVSGLSGTGLVLQNDGGNILSVNAGATSFTFATSIVSGGVYSVTVFSQPSNPTQTCVVTNGSGTVASANVTSVVVACVTEYTVGGTVSGLSGTGLVLQNNSGNNLPVSANGSFTFTTAIASGGAYSVTVLTQPSSPAQTCTVTSGSGTASANVTSVAVTCTGSGSAGFVLTGSMTTARFLHTATTLLNNGMVLIAGGDNTSLTLTSAELYDAAIGTFTATGSMTNARENHTTTLLNNGQVLIAGGNTLSSSSFWASAELYDPGTGIFFATGSMTSPRYGHSATFLDTGNFGKVLIAGGFNGSTALASAELYDAATGTFTATGSMTNARENQTATSLNNGQVLIAGGVNGSTALASAELYDISTGTFTATGSMTSPRYGHSATLLNNGKVLIAGGVNGTAFVASAELYDPATGTFTATGSMTNAREAQTATLLSDGNVLMAGGVNGSTALASAELYLPDTLTPTGLVSITVSPSPNPVVSSGSTQPFYATGKFSDNSTQILQSVNWSSSNTACVTITNDATNHGVASTGISCKSTITASAGSISASTVLTVQ